MTFDDSSLVHLPPVLSGYDAKRCARRVHNEFDATITATAWEPPPQLQMFFDTGIEFESHVFAAIRGVLGADRCRDLSHLVGRSRIVEATVAAMGDGVEVILGGWLPDDQTGGRKGRPDVLLRVRDSEGHAYVPGDVKGHQTIRAAATGRLRYSTLSDPARVQEVEAVAAQVTNRLDDMLQLAHYWRMLETCGRAPVGATPTGFIIGTDGRIDLDPSGFVLVWHDLAAPSFVTYSRSRGSVKRSAMERYDHEHAFRLQVADVARQRIGSPDDPEPLVQPIFKEECGSCPWYEFCVDLTGPDLASRRITSGRLTVREWSALTELGVSTVAELAALDPDAPPLVAKYLPEVSHVRKPLDRLKVAIRRAQMIQSGITLERETSGPVDVPRADVEIDFDIEWDNDDRVYLWGALVHRSGQEAAYEPTLTWKPLTEESTTELAAEFASWLRTVIQGAEAAGQTVLVYHYSHPETTYLRRLLGTEAVADLADHFIDLLAIVRKHYFGLEGLGIKRVAPTFGFHWRDEEPSGLQSQVWVQQARDVDAPGVSEPARRRLVAYNEDDVRATAAIREGLAAQTAGADK